VIYFNGVRVPSKDFFRDYGFVLIKEKLRIAETA
jgi:hypothetical protein